MCYINTRCIHYTLLRECSRFFSHTAERFANRRKEPESKISAWIKARLNFALIRSILLYLRGTRTPLNIDNISEINLCAIVTESNIRWIIYRFMLCYFTIIYMHGYTFIVVCMVTYWFVLFYMFFVFIPSQLMIWDLLLYLKEMMFTLLKNLRQKNPFMAPLYGWGSTASRLEPLRGGSLLFTTKFPKILGSHFINLERMKSWVDLGANQWFWTRDPWIGDPAP